MDFSLISDNKLKIILTKEDLQELDLSYETIRQGEEHAKQALVILLERGRELTGFHPEKAKLIVEVYPQEDGDGCVVCFTALQSVFFPVRERSMQPVVFEFEDVDTLTEGSCKVFARYSHRIYKSSLYRYKRKYRLVMYPLDYSDRLSVYFLSEFGKKVGEGDILAAHTEEYGEELIRDNALDKLSAHFGQTW